MYGLAPSFFGWTSRRMTNLRTYFHKITNQNLTVQSDSIHT